MVGSLFFRFAVALALLTAAASGQEDSEGSGEPEKSQPQGPGIGPAPELPQPAGNRPPANVAETSVEERREAVAWDIDAYLSTELRYRNAGDEDVLRLFAHMNTDARRAGENPMSFRFNGMLAARIAGDPQPGDLLYSVWDTFDNPVSGRLYEVFVAWDRTFGMPWRTTVGRQFIEEGTYLHFDGVRTDIDLDESVRDLELSIYGGMGVEWGEPNRDGHWMVGAILKGRHRKWKTRWRIQYLHLEERFSGINDPIVDPVNQPVSYPAQTLRDDMFGVTIWQPFGKRTHFFGRFTLLNDRANELNLRLRWLTADGRWALLAEWYQLFQRLFNITNDLTPFVPMLGSFEPFVRATARATWRPGELWIVEAGLAVRRLQDDESESTFNHQWTNYYLTVTRLDLWKEKLDFTMSVNGYESSGSDFTAVTSSIDIRMRRDLRLSLGLDYSLYKYDWFSDSERENIWTYRIDLRYEPKRSFRAVIGLAIDDDRVTTWTTLSVKLTWKF